MPYGLPKKINTSTNNAKMERCVEKVMKTGKSKESAIRICKAAIIRSHKLGET